MAEEQETPRAEEQTPRVCADAEQTQGLREQSSQRPQATPRAEDTPTPEEAKPAQKPLAANLILGPA